MSQVAKIDWVAKKWLLDLFQQQHHLTWDDPWLQSIDLEYHNLNPARGLYFSLIDQGHVTPLVSAERVTHCLTSPPTNTRANARGIAVRTLLDQNRNYIINWDSIAVENRDPLVMGNPFHPYRSEVTQLLADSAPR